jgi:Raf kinase inhibitor-like YbhB/YbcL family protein
MMKPSTRIGLVVASLLLVLYGCSPEATTVPLATPVSATAVSAGIEEPSPILPTEAPPPEPTVVDASTVPPATSEPTKAPLVLSSDAFGSGEAIPERYTCHGDNVSPPLEWAGVPERARSIALVVEDPDSSPPGFVHWVIYNIPPRQGSLPGGLPPEPTMTDGALQGKNDFAQHEGGTFPGGSPVHQVGYDGPCPPSGEHRYVFTLYALDTMLDLAAEATVSELMSAMKGRVLAQAELTGVYTAP